MEASPSGAAPPRLYLRSIVSRTQSWQSGVATEFHRYSEVSGLFNKSCRLPHSSYIFTMFVGSSQNSSLNDLLNRLPDILGGLNSQNNVKVNVCLCVNLFSSLSAVGLKRTNQDLNT